MLKKEHGNVFSKISSFCPRVPQNTLQLFTALQNLVS